MAHQRGLERFEHAARGLFVDPAVALEHGSAVAAELGDLIRHRQQPLGNRGAREDHIEVGRALAQAGLHLRRFQVAEADRQAQLIEHQQAEFAGEQLPAAEGPDLLDRSPFRLAVGWFGQAGGHRRTHPLQPAAEPEAVLRPLVDTALEELADQHPAAEPRGPQGLAEHPVEAAAERGRVHLQQALRLGQARNGAERAHLDARLDQAGRHQHPSEPRC